MAEMVKSVEFFEVNSPTTDVEYDLTLGQDYTNCVPFFSNHGGQDYSDTKSWDCWFDGTTESGTVKFHRHNARSTEGYIKCFVVEFDPDEVYVEHGAFDASTATDTVTTSGVFNPERTGMVHHWWASDGTQGYMPRHNCRGRVVTSGTLEFYRSNYGASMGGHWFLFECKDDQFTVEHTLFTSSSATNYHHCQRSYDPLKTFFISSVAGGYNGSGYMSRGAPYIRLENRDTIRCARVDSNDNVYPAVQVIEFQDRKIHVPFVATVTMNAPTVNVDWDRVGRSRIPVDLDYSMVIKSGGHFDYLAVNNSSVVYLDGMASSVKFTGVSGIQIQKNTFTLNTHPSIFVVDWRGYTVSGTTNPDPIDPDVSFVKSVQNLRITADIWEGLGYLTKGQDINNCVPFASSCPEATSSNTPTHGVTDVFFSDIGVVETRRIGTTSDGIADVSVVEFYPDQVRVQSGTFAGAAPTEVLVPLEHTIDVDKSFLYVKWSSQTTTNQWRYFNLRCRIVDEDNVGFLVAVGDYTHATWYVVEDITTDNSCFDVNHFNISTTGDANVVTGEKNFPANNTFFLLSYAGGYAGADYNERNCARAYYVSPNEPQKIDVFNAVDTKYYASQQIRIRRSGLLYTQQWGPTLTTTSSTRTFSAMAGKTNVSVLNTNLLGAGAMASTTHDFCGAVLSAGRITDYDSMAVEAVRGYAGSSSYPLYSFYYLICWEGVRIEDPPTLLPTRSFIRSVAKYEYVGSAKTAIKYFNVDQEAKNCIPLATWNVYGGTIGPEECLRYISLDHMFGKPYSLCISRPTGTRNSSDTTNTYIVEFDDEQVKVQSGTIGIHSADFNITIEEVNLNKAFLLFYNAIQDNQTWTASNLSGTFEDSTTLRFRRVKNSGNLFVSWFVVECLQDQWEVQHLFNSAGASSTSIYNHMDHRPASSRYWVFNSAAGAYDGVDYPERNNFRTVVRSDNVVEINRANSINTINYFNSEVVTFNNNLDMKIFYEDISSTSYRTFKSYPPLNEENTVVFNPTANNLGRSNATSHDYGSRESFFLQELSDFGEDGPLLTVTKSSSSFASYGCACVTGFPEYKKYYMEGYTKEKGNPVPREVRAYRSDTGQLMDTTISVSGTGYFWTETTYSGAHYVVCLDDEAGFDYNDLIYSRIYPTVISGTFAWHEGLVATSGVEYGVPLGRL